MSNNIISSTGADSSDIETLTRLNQESLLPVGALGGEETLANASNWPEPPSSLAQVSSAGGFSSGLDYNNFTCQTPLVFGDFSVPLFASSVGSEGGIITSSVPILQSTGSLSSSSATGLGDAVRVSQTLTCSPSQAGARASSSAIGMSGADQGVKTPVCSSYQAGTSHGSSAIGMSRAGRGSRTLACSSYLAGTIPSSSATGMSRAGRGFQPLPCSSHLAGTTPGSSAIGMSDAVRGSRPPTCSSSLAGTSAGFSATGMSDAGRGFRIPTCSSSLAGTSNMGSRGVTLTGGAPPQIPWLNPATGEIRYHAFTYGSRSHMEGFNGSYGPHQTVTTTSSATGVTTTPLVSGPSRAGTVLTTQPRFSSPANPAGMPWGGMPAVDPFAQGFFPLAGVQASATPRGPEVVQPGSRLNPGPWMGYSGVGTIPTGTLSAEVGPQQRPASVDFSTGGTMEVDSDGLPSEEDLDDGLPQSGGSYRRNQSAMAEASFRDSLEGLFDILPNKLQRPPQVPDPQGYFSEDEIPQKDSSSGSFLTLPLSGRNRHYMDMSSRAAREAMVKKLTQAQRSSTCNNKVTLGLPVGVPHDVFKRMYTLNGEDWQRGLCPPNLHNSHASTLGLGLPPKEFLVSQDQFNNLDLWARTHVGVSSTLQFFQSGISTLLGQMSSCLEKLQLAEDTVEMASLVSTMSDAAESASRLDVQMKRVVNSNSSIAGHQALQLTMISRDRWLSQMPDSVSPETILDLRSAPIKGGDLLDPQLLALASQQVSDRQQLLIRRDLERAAQVNLKREAGTSNSSGKTKPKKARRKDKAPSSADPSVAKLSGQMQNLQSALKAIQAQKAAAGGGTSSNQQGKKSSRRWSKGGKPKASNQDQKR